MSDHAKVGAVEILAFVDGKGPPGETSRSFPQTTPEMWEPYKDLLYDGKHQHQFGFFGLRSRDHTILVDTGLGPGPHANLGGAPGALMDQIRAKGITPEDVDLVLITHLHGDHVGWNVTEADGKFRPTFPRARYYVPKVDWDYFTKPDVLATQEAIQKNVVPLRELGVLELVEPDATVTPELSFWSTPGHTLGHQSVMINSQGERGIVVGDLFSSPVQVSEPAWQMRADMDPEQGSKTRVAVFDRLEREGFTVASSHLLINSNIGKLVRLEGGRRYWQVL